MAESTAEPFHVVNTSADQQHGNAGTTRRRRKSSGLGTEIRAGDTGAPSLQSSLASLQESRNGHATSPGQDAAAAPLPLKRGQKGYKRRKTRSFLRRCKHFAFKHTWVLPLVILAIIGLLYAINPTETNPLHFFIFLAYEMPPDPNAEPDAPVQYGKGLWDIAFVAFYTVVLSFTREFVMQEMLRPLAKYYGIRTRGKQARFMEQAYTAVYFSFLGPAGLYVMSRTPVWYFNTRGMYENFPHRTHDGPFKFYYLFQAAYWAQQAIVLMLGMEKPRKDFKELVGHHIVSLFLIGLSYRFHFTYMGLAVYITHDISDFFLAMSKVFNYIDTFFVGPFFFVFMCVWIYLRHYLNLRLIASMFTEYQTVGPYELNWETQQYKCWISFYITLALLASLQALNLFWLFFILRIAYRFIRYAEADDDRSEAEESEIEDEKNKAAAKGQSRESTPLMNDGKVTSRGNGAASPSSKKKSAR